jgi:hypothetical protein
MIITAQSLLRRFIPYLEGNGAITDAAEGALHYASVKQDSLHIIGFLSST